MTSIPSYLQHGEISEVLFTREQVESRIKELGRIITQHYKPLLGGQPLIVVAILKGSFMFFSDLVKELDLDLTTEFMILKSYTGTERSSEINVVQDLNRPISGRHVLVVEDILDTGHTLHKIYDLLTTRSPASLQTAVMLHKTECTVAEAPRALFVGFDIPNKFVVGYGLDYEQRLRAMPFIGVWNPAAAAAAAAAASASP